MKKNGPVNTQDILGQKAYFKIRNQEELTFFGIKEAQFYARVVGVDNFGVWIENPKWEFVRVRDDAGEIIPPEKRKMEVHRTHVLLFWGTIVSIMTCPGREGFDVHEAKEIGVKDEARYL
ncbi:MAG TPA: hypothetical protein VMX35_14355 [Acidobacteriota bacterium]|nr:hypothetical protein [Acidobacteriota bacterium]